KTKWQEPPVPHSACTRCWAEFLRIQLPSAGVLPPQRLAQVLQPAADGLLGGGIGGPTIQAAAVDRLRDRTTEFVSQRDRHQQVLGLLLEPAQVLSPVGPRLQLTIMPCQPGRCRQGHLPPSANRHRKKKPGRPKLAAQTISPCFSNLSPALGRGQHL